MPKREKCTLMTTNLVSLRISPAFAIHFLATTTPIGEVGRLSFRVQQLNVRVETKTVRFVEEWPAVKDYAVFLSGFSIERFHDILSHAAPMHHWGMIFHFCFSISFSSTMSLLPASCRSSIASCAKSASRPFTA
jgi:hypothetical protein